MSDFISWKFLEKQLQSFKKKAKYETLSPAEITSIEPNIPKNVEQQAHPSDPKNENEGISYVNRIKNDKNSGETPCIEIQNVKGKIVKINPDDYEVTILAGNNILFQENIKKIASGMYQNILRSYGTEKTLHCIIKDFINTPEIFEEPKINFIQAKTILSSLKGTLGYVPEESISEVISKLDKKNACQIVEWLKSKK